MRFVRLSTGFAGATKGRVALAYGAGSVKEAESPEKQVRMMGLMGRTKWAAPAAMLLLLAQPGAAQQQQPAAEDARSLDEFPDRRIAETAEAPPAPGARTAPPQPEPRPALWLLQDEDTRIYLLGTIHILPPGFRWRSAAIDGVIERADELVLELSDREEAMADPAVMLEPMQLGKQAPLAWRVSPDRREALGELIAELGLYPQMFDGMHSWAAAMMIMAVAAMRDLGADGSGDETPLSRADIPGVEDGLEVEFRARNKPITGVETVAQQIGFFSSMSFAGQRELLEQMIDEYQRGGLQRGDGRTDLHAWVSGRPEAIAIPTDGLPPPLYEALLPRRNRAWTDWLIARLERPGTVLFAVGAGHLTGPDSVQTMLEGRGFTAARVD